MENIIRINKDTWRIEDGHVRFFLFCPGLTCFSIASGEMNYLPVGASILYENGADIATMNVRFAPNVTKEYNAELCELLGVTVPADYTPIK